VVDQASRALRKISTTALSTTRNITGIGASMKKAGYHMTSMRGIISAAYGAAMVAFPIKQAAAFEAALIDIERVSDFKPGGLDRYKQFLIEQSIYLGKNVEDLGKMGYALAKFLDKSDDLVGFTKLASEVAASFDIPEVEAAEQIGKITAKMGLDLAGVKDLFDAMNYSADRTATSMKNQLQIMARVAPDLASFNMPPKFAAAWANFADQMKATPRIAAKGLEMFLREVSQMRGGLRKLFAPGADANKIFLEFLEKMEKMPKIQAKMRASGIFTTRTARTIGSYVDRLDLLKKSMRLVGEGGKYVGSMQRELEKKLTSANTSIGVMKAMLNELSRVMGDIFLPYLKQLAKDLVPVFWEFRRFLMEHPNLIKIVMGVIALVTVLSAAGIVIGLLSIAFGAILSTAGLIVLGIAAIGAGFAYMYNNSENFRSAVMLLIAPFREIWGYVQNIFGSLFGGVDGSAVWGGVFAIIETVAVNAMRVLAVAINLVTWPLRAVLFLMDKVIDFFVNIQEYAGVFSDFATTLSSAIGGGLSGIGDFFSDAASATGEYVSGAVNKNTLNGQIEVSASKGSEVVGTKMDSQPSGNVGFSYGGVGGI